jgi:hypothetical protein
VFNPAGVVVPLDRFTDRGARRLLLKLARQLAAPLEPSAVTSVRAWMLDASERIERRICPEVQFVGHVLCDLAGQGWSASVDRGRLLLRAPSDGGPSEEGKARIKAAHLVERDAQLALPAVRRFITSMETRRVHNGQWRSVLSLIHDGPDLARKLQSTVGIADESARADALKQLVDPYVQVIRGDDTCEFTGLRLLDVWRYFRHTWTTAYQSTPGRKMFVLVRNRAQPQHPVMGIAALGSAVVQLSARDAWIGWSAEDVTAAFRQQPEKLKEWLLAQVDDLIRDVYVADFLRQSVLTRRDISSASVEAAARLRRVAADAKAAHRLDPQPSQHKQVSRTANVQWARQATTNLFRWKRAATLDGLLLAKRALLDADFDAREAAVETSAFQRAASTIVRGIKAKHVGIDVMDITVCGAIAPYNHLLGGKLISLLMASPQVARSYEARYKEAASVIASSMAGRPVVRRPSLVLLGTTSLYGTGASQYNRLRMPVQTARGARHIEFVELGKTAGYGSFHFSTATMSALESVLRRGRRGRPVNSIFGEGVNPKLRKLRSGFDSVGLPAELLLKHGSPRLVYGIPLADNFRHVLLGIAKRPDWIVSREPSATQSIIDYWVRRWLARRVARTAAIDAVQCETLTHPVRHAAKVRISSETEPFPFDEHEAGEGTSDEETVRLVS